MHQCSIQSSQQGTFRDSGRVAKKVGRLSNSAEILDVPADNVTDLLGGFFECVSPDIETRLTSENAVTIIQPDALYRSQQRRDDFPQIDPVFFRCCFKQKAPDNVLGWWNHKHVFAQDEAGKFLLD